MTNNNTLEERCAKKIYDIIPYDGLGEKPKWVENGNSLIQDEARKCADEIIQQAKEEEMNRIEDKFIKYVNWNWHASLGYGEDLKIFEKALEEYSWLELDKESILNKLSNTK